MILNTNLCCKTNLRNYPYKIVSNTNSDFKIVVKNQMPIISIICVVKYFVGSNFHTVTSSEIKPEKIFTTKISREATLISVSMFKYIQHGSYPLICTKDLQ